MSLELILSEQQLKSIKTRIVPSTLKIYPNLQQEIDKSWELFLKEMKHKGIKAWNGKKYRFESIDDHTINLSETDFKTNLCLRRIGQMQLRNNAVVVANIMTNDNYLVFGRRKNVGVNEGTVAWIAAGVEPIENSTDLLSDNMKVELKEELGLNQDDYSLSLDVVAKFCDQGIYGFHFDTYTKLSKDQILEKFSQAEHKDEHSELLFYENNEEGISKLKNEKDMLPEVVEFFSKFYEFKY